MAPFVMVIVRWKYTACHSIYAGTEEIKMTPFNQFAIIRKKESFWTKLF